MVFLTRCIPFAALFALVIAMQASSKDCKKKGMTTEMEQKKISLPKPRKDSEFSLEKSLNQRRSIRNYSESPISLEEASQILWSAQGITDSSREYRSAPSAGATFPLNTYLAVGNVEDLSPGIYRYNPSEHNLELVHEGDIREKLREATYGQSPLQSAPATLFFSAVYSRTTQRYDERGIRYTHMEAGHAAQNAYLQATALGLGMVAVGAFKDRTVKNLFRLSENETPLYLLPFGYKK